MKATSVARKTSSSKNVKKGVRPRALAPIIRVLRRELPRLTKKYKIRSLGVFGSFVRGEQKPTSDLDVLVEFQETNDFSDHLGLEEELSRRFGIKVEVVENEFLKPYVGKHIRRQVVWLLKDGAAQPVPVLVRSAKSKTNGAPNGAAMEPEREYLDWIMDMITSMQDAQQYVAGITYEQMLGDGMRRAAVERATEKIGEAANRIPAEVRKRYPQISWSKIIGMRHLIVHGYDKINYEKIWDTIHSSIPRDLPVVRAMLDAEKKRRNIEK